MIGRTGFEVDTAGSRSPKSLAVSRFILILHWLVLVAPTEKVSTPKSMIGSLHSECRLGHRPPQNWKGAFVGLRQRQPGARPDLSLEFTSLIWQNLSVFSG